MRGRKGEKEPVKYQAQAPPAQTAYEVQPMEVEVMVMEDNQGPKNQVKWQ
jgi:hypothetical protein